MRSENDLGSNYIKFDIKRRVTLKPVPPSLIGDIFEELEIIKTLSDLKFGLIFVFHIDKNNDIKSRI